MKSFKEYIEDSLKNSTKQDLLNKLIKFSWERYNPETRDFFEKIATKDANIKQIMQKLSRGNVDDENSIESDVIVQNASDSNFGNEEI